MPEEEQTRRIFSIATLAHQGRFLFDIPIVVRLVLGFLLTAFIMLLLSGITSIQHAQMLSNESDFYDHLLESNIHLENNATYLQLMDSEMHNLINQFNTPNSSAETIQTEKTAVARLSTQYDILIRAYVAHELLAHNSNDTTLLPSTTRQTQVTTQSTLASSALRTWMTYDATQKQIILEIDAGNITEAREVERIQAEPLQADALSALRSLIHFNENLAAAVHNTQIDTNQFMGTIITTTIAFIVVALIGVVITWTFAERLNQLRRVMKAVEAGELDMRLPIVGHDELAVVSAGINSMMERIIADRQVALAYEQERQLNQIKDQFIVNVSHELRTPLTEVYGYIELLSDYDERIDTETQQTFLKNARDGCQELLNLVNTILDANYSEDSMRPPRQESLSLVTVVREEIDHFDPRQREQHAIQIEIPTSLSVQADGQYVRQILRNLISNAFKYAPPQTPVIISAYTQTVDAEIAPTEPICLESAIAPQQVHIQIRDYGPGIPPNEMHLLFQKFVRLKRDLSGTKRGTGLGLYISKQLVQAMHGEIWAESSGIFGEGSCFIFTLPPGISTPQQADNHASRSVP